MSSTVETLPMLPVFINSQLERAVVTSLPVLSRNCVICKRKMCDCQHTEKPSDTCHDARICELAIRVTAPNCDHVFGSRCLEKHLLDGITRCPVCNREWYQPTEVRRQILKESYLWPSGASDEDKKEANEQPRTRP